MEKFKIFFITKELEENFEKLAVSKSLKKLNIPYFGLFNNTLGISECYNIILSSEEVENVEYAIFIHDDLIINDLFLQEKLEENFKNYDIIGIAGSSDFNIKRTPLSWINCDRNAIAGWVEHPIENKNMNSKSAISFYGVSPKEVAIIDGCFIAFNIKKIKEKNIKFDERFAFNFYDLDFCLSCIMSNLKIGVVGINCKHLSQGSGIKELQFKIDEEIFKEKWRKDGKN